MQQHNACLVGLNDVGLHEQVLLAFNNEDALVLRVLDDVHLDLRVTRVSAAKGYVGPLVTCDVVREDLARAALFDEDTLTVVLTDVIA